MAGWTTDGVPAMRHVLLDSTAAHLTAALFDRRTMAEQDPPFTARDALTRELTRVTRLHDSDLVTQIIN